MKTERFEMRFAPGLLTRLDDWRRRQPDLPSRAEAIRRLIEAGLDMPPQLPILGGRPITAAEETAGEPAAPAPSAPPKRRMPKPVGWSNLKNR